MPGRRPLGLVAVCVAVICSASPLVAQRARDSSTAPTFRPSALRHSPSTVVARNAHSKPAFPTTADEKDRHYKMIIGGVVGGGIGAAIGFEAGMRSDDANPDAFAVNTPKYTAAGAVLGILVGVLVGRVVP